MVGDAVTGTACLPCEHAVCYTLTQLLLARMLLLTGSRARLLHPTCAHIFSVFLAKVVVGQRLTIEQPVMCLHVPYVQRVSKWL